MQQHGCSAEQTVKYQQAVRARGKRASGKRNTQHSTTAPQQHSTTAKASDNGRRAQRQDQQPSGARLLAGLEPKPKHAAVLLPPSGHPRFFAHAKGDTSKLILFSLRLLKALPLLLQAEEENTG